MVEPVPPGVEDLIPSELRGVKITQNDMPRIAKDSRLMRQIESALHSVPTHHRMHLADAR